MSLKWVDVQEIAIQLAEAHPEVNPLTVNFVKLRDLVMALPEFDDIPDRGGEKSWRRFRVCGSKKQTTEPTFTQLGNT